MEHEADTQSVSAGAAEDGGRVRVVGASDSAEPQKVMLLPIGG